MDKELVKKQIEGLLFISHKPLSVKEFAKLVGSNEELVKGVLASIASDYQGRGIQLVELSNKYQLTTSKDSSEVVGKFLKSEITGELTKPSLETLTVVVYRGPISKAELELIRGVNCSIILRNLMMRGLIEAKENKKRAVIMYDITLDFMKYLGITNRAELPDFEKLNKNDNLEKLLASGEGLLT
jgi:segregation and condensation protein B